MGKKFGFEFFLKLYCNDLDMLQIHPLDSWKIPAWEEPCTWEGHRVMYARFLPWLSLHSRVSLHWRCGALVATLYVSLDSNKHPWVGNCIKICDNFLAHFVTRMWRVSYPCTYAYCTHVYCTVVHVLCIRHTVEIHAHVIHQIIQQDLGGLTRWSTPANIQQDFGGLTR